MAYAGLVKRAKSHFENCNNCPEETPVQGDGSYILTPRATSADIIIKLPMHRYHEIMTTFIKIRIHDVIDDVLFMLMTTSQGGLKLSLYIDV